MSEVRGTSTTIENIVRRIKSGYKNAAVVGFNFPSSGGRGKTSVAYESAYAYLRIPSFRMRLLEGMHTGDKNWEIVHPKVHWHIFFGKR